MAALRCWPGCLAQMSRSKAGNHGRIVEVIRPATPGDVGAGSRAYDGAGHRWLVRSATPLISNLGNTFSEFAFPDAWLRPITPPPSVDTETVADVLDLARRHPAEV